MLSQADKYRQIIQEGTKESMLFSGTHQGKKPTCIYQSDLIIQSVYPFRSSHEINNNNISNIQLFVHQTSTQNITTSSQYDYPISCIGLSLCQYRQANKTYSVYGTGILIHNNIVLTNAQNVYCRRLNTQYRNIQFMGGVNGNKCSGIYDVKRVHYPKEYTKQEGYEYYDVAILQLYDDLSESCGYVGLKQDYKTEGKETKVYEYMSDNSSKEVRLNLRIAQCGKFKQSQSGCSGIGVLLKKQNQYYIAGMMSSTEKYTILIQEILNMIDRWTKQNTLQIYYKNLRHACGQIAKYTTSDLTQLILNYNNIDAQGCKHLSQARWTNLTKINLSSNSIRAQGCKYLSQANWIHLTHLNLWKNSIGVQGCKYISQANWIHLTNIDLWNNNINAEGCKYLSQTKWIHLIQINLSKNNWFIRIQIFIPNQLVTLDLNKFNISQYY